MQPPPRGRTLRRRSPRWASTPPAIMPSATYAQVPIADVFDERLGRPLREVGAVLEAVGFPEVLARHLALRRPGGEVQGRPNDCASPAEFVDRAVALLVHHEDVLEEVAVFGSKLPSPLGAAVQATEGGTSDRPLVRRPPARP